MRNAATRLGTTSGILYSTLTTRRPGNRTCISALNMSAVARLITVEATPSQRLKKKPSRY